MDFMGNCTLEGIFPLDLCRAGHLPAGLPLGGYLPNDLSLGPIPQRFARVRLRVKEISSLAHMLIIADRNWTPPIPTVSRVPGPDYLVSLARD